MPFLSTLFLKVKLIYQDEVIRRRLLITFFLLVLFRLAAAIPVPGVDTGALARFFSGSQFFGLLNIFSGGGLSNLSIMMLGVGPFITASIIMQLLTVVFPRLKALYHEEGEAGRKRMNQYSRLLTVPLAMLQGFGLLVLLERQDVIADLSLSGRLTNVIIITAGSLLLMWLGELISEHGFGNGVSLIIFAGILASLPANTSQVIATFDSEKLPVIIGFLLMAVVIIAGVVAMTEAERPIPVTYAKQVRGMKLYGGASTYLPLRLNHAGVMPIIFALSILLFPQMIANFLAASSFVLAQTIANIILRLLANTWLYAFLYFVLVFVFTFFYSAVTFDPQAIATNLQKSGAFISGVRPGDRTADYLGKVITRLTLVGALFLGIIALLPLLMQGITGLAALAIGGTSLLIVVSVALEFVKQLNAQLAMREY